MYIKTEGMGWLNKYLYALDQLTWKRWDYWMRVIDTNQLPSTSIPRIRFDEYPNGEVKKNIAMCLSHAQYKLSNPLGSFIEWLLWGFGKGDEENPPSIPEDIDKFWYENFNLGLFYLEPGDHWAGAAMDALGRHNALGFFPTPMNVVNMMVNMTFGSEPKPEHMVMSVEEPTMGTGRMLMAASNYSLRLFGQDISRILVDIATVNAIIYVPWLVAVPKSLTIFNFTDDKDTEEAA